MLSNNTNKATGVGIAVGVAALVGVSTMALFPNAMDSVKTTVAQAATKFTGNTDEGVVDDYDTSNHDYTFDDTNNTAVIGTIKAGKDKDKGSVVVPSYVTKSGTKYKVVAIDGNAYRDSPELTDVVIPDNVKTIGEGAFADDTHLTNLTIGKGVETIGDSAFQHTTLSSVTVPDNVKTIGKRAFADNPNDEDGFVSIGKNTTYSNDDNDSSFGAYGTWDGTIGWYNAYRPTIRN